MSGRATLTIVMSSSSMNVATQTAISVHHLRSMPSSSRGRGLTYSKRTACARPAASPVWVAGFDRADTLNFAVMARGTVFGRDMTREGLHSPITPTALLERDAALDAVGAVLDAHWVDRPTLRFVHYLAQRLAGLPVAVVLARRPDEGREQDPLLDALATHPTAAVARLRPLSSIAAGRLVWAKFPDASDGF